MKRGGSVYILTNEHHTVFYTGVSANLYVRICEHRERKYPKSFSSRYNTFKLVYVEDYHSIQEAISREKQIKKYRREKKIELIEEINPGWKDLFKEL